MTCTPATIYPWMIQFSDLTDESIKKLGEDYFTTHPSTKVNYWNLTAQKFISFIGSMGVNSSTIANLNRTTNPPHYLVTQWLVNCFQMLVAQNLIGLNDVENVNQDKYMIKYKMYRDELKNTSSALNYETIISGNCQQNYTRSNSMGFRIRS